MDNYLIWYLFVKLDDVKSLLYFDPAGIFLFLFLSLVGCACIFIFTGLLFDLDPTELGEAVLKKKDKYIRRVAIIAVVAFGFIFTSNTVSTIMPSTGQLAAIYIGKNAVDSDAAKTISKLPNKYAQLLEKKADDWLAEQEAKVIEKAKE